MKEDIWFKKGIELSEIQLEGLINILTKKCGDKAKKRIRSLVTYDLDTLIQTCCWLERFYICGVNQEVHYCAGQSYPCEIRTIRQQLMKSFP